MISFTRYIAERIVTSGPGQGIQLAKQEHRLVTWNELMACERVIDALFRTAGLDIAFTTHFWERMNGSRGDGQWISTSDIQLAFRKTFDKFRDTISNHPVDWEAVINDTRTNLNMPFVIKWDGKFKRMVMLTAMRSPNFRSPDIMLRV